ncbi:MAG: molecular chaperone HtpG, partial [Parvibaculaceae bacterium]
LARQGTTDVKVSKPVLELNAGHVLIQALAATAKAQGASPELNEAASLLLDLARVMDGEQVADPAKFTGCVCTLMQKSFGSVKA